MDKERKLFEAKMIAKKKNIKNWDTLEVSNVKNKRFSIISPKGYKINFGLWPYNGKGAFIDHKDESIKKAWHARHIKILKDDKPAYKDMESAEYYSWNILW